MGKTLAYKILENHLVDRHPGSGRSDHHQDRSDPDAGLYRYYGISAAGSDGSR